MLRLSALQKLSKALVDIATYVAANNVFSGLQKTIGLDPPLIAKNYLDTPNELSPNPRCQRRYKAK